MSLGFYFQRLKEEKFSPRFILSRLILRMGLRLPLKLSLDKSIGGKIYFRPSPFPHNLFVKGYTYKLNSLIFKRFIKEGDIVFDVGANIGALSILFSYLCGKGKVFAFEPTKKTFGFLLDNINLNSSTNIFPVNVAISDVNGIVGLVEHKYSDGFNYINKTDKKNKSKVLSLRLNLFLDVLNLAKIDFLKIDTEGAELLVLKSLGNRIQDVKVIYFEFHRENYLRFGYRRDEIINFLKYKKFNVFIPTLKKDNLILTPFERDRADIGNINLIALNTVI